ncbi:MAG TPA: hypothetical protein VMT58_07625 [Candidatus Binataceae bacterium]|nr:hypothetical protein [Candidatus Binataceae bacterium]
MGGFFILSKTGEQDAPDALIKSRNQFRSSGFGTPISFESDDRAIDYYPKLGGEISNLVRFDSGDFILSVGSLFFRGRSGDEALRLLYREPDIVVAIAAARGHFAVIVRKDGVTRLIQDAMGAYEVFLSREGRCATTSFLAAAAVAPRLTIQDHEVYEYVFNGVCLGASTPFAEVRKLDFSERLTLAPGWKIERGARVPDFPQSDEPLSTLLERNLDGLVGYASELADRFGDNIRLALSGGYDSRFLLALFRRAGVTPKLFVYGSAGSQDVRMALQIAQAEGIKVDHIDKSALSAVTPDDYAAVVEKNFHMEDALPWGGIFTTGAELVARRQRNENGALHVNGGGGEVFRNYFYLLDRPISPRGLVWTFFSQYSAAQCTPLFDRRDYEEKIAAKIESLFGLSGSLLSRPQVEAAYPYFRCRSWFGRENSINNRWGYSVLPFFEYRTVKEALRIPVRYKEFGNFEAAMIRRADPSLARHASNYGHDFTGNRPLVGAIQDVATYVRPPWLRRLTFPAKALVKGREPRSSVLSDSLLERVLDPRFPRMSRYFRVDRITSTDQFARICTLEYALDKLGAV